MARATTKTDVLDNAIQNFDKLTDLIASMTQAQLDAEFDFSVDEKKKEAHWRRDKNLRDIYIHLYEWHRLLIDWISSNQNGDLKPFIPQPYNWKSYGDMNIKFWKKHQQTTLEEARGLLEASHQDILALVETFTNEQLFSKGIYTWVGGSVLGSYFVSATASHYDWAMKKLKAHIKKCKE